MNESIFSRLFHYRQTEKMSPKENYLTEMLCWLINNCPTFAKDYLDFLVSKDNTLNNEIRNVSNVFADTQIYINDTVNDGFIDMVITTDTDLVIICEHKIDSSLSEGQLDKYRNNTNDDWNKDKTRIVLVTKKTSQHGQNPDIKLVWNEIYEHFHKELENDSHNYKEIEQFLIEQFLLYLTEEGMGMEKSIVTDCIEYYRTAIELPRILLSMFNEIKDEIEAKDDNNLKEISSLSTNPGLVVNEHYGRYGINFYKEWTPINIFAGAVLKNENFGISDELPQFSIMIDCQKNEKKEACNKEWVKALKNNLKDEQGGFKVEKDPQSPWRLLILKKNLSDVIKGTEYKEQKESLKSEVINGIKLILDNCK